MKRVLHAARAIGRTVAVLAALGLGVAIASYARAGAERDAPRAGVAAP